MKKILFVGLFLIASRSFGAANTLTKISPPGGRLSEITIAPATDTAFSICASRLYRSKAAPAWEDITGNISPLSFSVYSVAISAGTPTRVFASIGKVVVSADNGDTWSDSSTGLPADETVSNLATDPTNPLNVYALTSGHDLYRTVDGGKSWTFTRSMGTGGTLIVDPWRPATLFFRSNSATSRSDDSGTTFTPITLPQPPSGGFTISPGENLILTSTANGIYQSIDYGDSWTLVNPATYNKLVFSSRGVVFAVVDPAQSIERSDDNAKTFTLVDQAGADCYGIAATGSMVVASYVTGTRISFDRGDSWTDASAGLPGNGTRCFVVAPSDPDTAFACTFGGIARTVDAGLTWSYQNNGLPRDTVPMIVAIDPTSPLRALTYVDWSLFNTTDGGDTWLSLGTMFSGVACLTYDPSDPSVVYSGSFSGDYGVQKSINGGLSWTTMGAITAPVHEIAVDSQNPSTIYAAADGGVYKSTDGASSWTQPGGAIPNAWRIAIAPSNHDVLYSVAGNAHIYRSGDAGANWVDLTGNIPRPPTEQTVVVFALAVDPNNPDTVYVGVDVDPYLGIKGIHGFFKSVDGGQTWSRMIDSWAQMFPTALVIRPDNPNFLYIGALSGAYTFEQVPPSAASITPSSGDAAGGVSVIIGGTYFMSSSGVLFDTTAASVTSATTTSIAASTPSLPPGTFHDVTVMNPTLMSSTLPKAFFADYSDVPASYLLHDYVVTLTKDGVTLGCAAGLYCPNDSVLRSQMAAFIARAKAGGDANVPATGVVGSSPYNCSAGGISLFSDVAPEDVFCRHIHYIAAAGITLGCGAGQYCPMQSVSRLQMALFLARAIAGSDAAVPDSYTDPITGRSYDLPNGVYHFDDVPPSDPFSKQAHYIWALGVTDGCQATLYCPTNLTSRGQMAKFLVNAFGLQ